MDAIDKNGVSRSAHDLLMDIQWNCEHCTARIDYETRAKYVMVVPGGRVGGNPCQSCRMHKYGYGGIVQ